MQTYLPTLPLPLVHHPLLHNPQPITERAVQHKIRSHRRRGIRLRTLPSELPVKVEERARDGDGCVPEDQAHVGLGVDLAEFEGVEVVGESVVGCVFEVWGNVRLGGRLGDGGGYRRGSGLLFSGLRTS
jgi:hypothetical protein